jgi:CheY-like chemotaxis protein
MTPGKPRILCVDDEPLNLSLLEAMLLPRGYEVVQASGIKKSQKGDSLLNESRMNLAGGTIHKWILNKNSGGRS